MLTILVLRLIAGLQTAAPGDAELPRVFLNTAVSATPSNGRIVRVKASDNLQRALDGAECGDRILLPAGAKFTGNFLIGRDCTATSWITLSTDGCPSLPAEGTRTSPAAAACYAKLVSKSVNPALATKPTAKFWRIIGVEFTNEPNLTQVYSTVLLGDASTLQNTLAKVPTDLILDRVYVHAPDNTDDRRCISLQSARSAVIDSYVSNCKSAFDAQAITSTNSPGPLKIVNNFLEATGENIAFGGGDPHIQGLVPSDIEIRRNYFFKRLDWKTNKWGENEKNLLESKNSSRVLVEGNVFENNWLDAQVGFALVLKSDDQSGHAPWSVTRNVTIRYNKLLNSPGGVDIMATGNKIREPANRILITDNLFDCRGTERLGGLGRLWQLVEDPFEIDIEHNTGLADSIALMLDTRQKSRVVVRNNIMTRGTYGIFGTSRGEGNSAIDYYLPGAVITNNVLIGTSTAQYPAGNFFVASASDVGFVDFAHRDYRLRPGSRFKGAGSDGRDLGADMDAVEKATAGVVIH